MSRLPRRLSMLLLCLLLTAVAVPSAHAATARSAQTLEARDLLAEVLTAYADRIGPTDPRYYDGRGHWVSPDAGCFACMTGPGAAAAVLSTLPGAPDAAAWRKRAIQTFDAAIAEHRQADGGFAGAGNSPDLNTVFFGAELGHAYIALRDKLPTLTRRRWQRALAKGADFLTRKPDGIDDWYVNGNINLGVTQVLWFAWQATGDAKYERAYERSWRFVMSPPKPRWSGRGLVLDGQGGGWLTETGPGGTGFDPEYGQLQMDVAARMAVLSNDARARRLLSLLAAAELPRVDAGYQLDTSGGTRHQDAGRTIPFTTPGLAVLAYRGGRGDMAARLPAQWARISKEFRHATTYTHRNFYRATGNQLAVLAQAAAPRVAVRYKLRRVR